MKKFISILIALTMLLSAVSALAVDEINWSDIEAQVEDINEQGQFVTFDEVAIKIWIPNGLNAVELTDEDREQGYIGYYITDDQTTAISVMYVDVDGMTLEEYKAKLEENGATEITDALVNGITAVTYELDETDTMCVTFVTEAGYILEFAAAPKSDANVMTLMAMAFASIQPE